jgi:RNA polymerase sigma-70 factor (ECF subfamily)
MKKKIQDNVTLIEHLKKGDEKAYVFLMDSYNRKLFAYALSLTDDKDIAKDIVQNVFLRIWEFRKKLNSFHSIQGLLYKSVYNEFINQYRKNQSAMILEKKYIEALNEVVEDTDPVTLERLITIVSKEIQKLPPKCKHIFLLSKKEGLTNIEISKYLNLSIKTVESQITKAFFLIRNKIKAKTGNIYFLLFVSKVVKTMLFQSIVVYFFLAP